MMMKFLCSFGGRILPRPSDGKLRYVGGQTRILQIRKDMSWQELKQKAIEIYDQTHEIKYQHPHADLDALVSVSSDEDLHNMMEECNNLDDREGSQKLRIILFSMSDLEDAKFGLSGICDDFEDQYVSALNSKDLGSRKNSNMTGVDFSANNYINEFDKQNINNDFPEASVIVTTAEGHSERIPQELDELLNRSSKSDDAHGSSQFLVSDLLSDVRTPNSIKEIGLGGDDLHDGHLSNKERKFGPNDNNNKPLIGDTKVSKLDIATAHQVSSGKHNDDQASNFPKVDSSDASVKKSNDDFNVQVLPISSNGNTNKNDDSEQFPSNVVSKQVQDDLQVIMNKDLAELKEQGSGSFGTVYYGKWRGSDVAIKRINKTCFSGRSSERERLKKELWQEAEILSKLRHPNVMAFYGVVKDGPEGTMATVTEYMVDGSLSHASDDKDGFLDPQKRLIIATDAARGMEYLHSKNIIHFDLKCEILLVNLKDPLRPICKVGDFGLSKIKQNTLVSGVMRGTFLWMAPELLRSQEKESGSNNKVSEKVDVFSFGIVLREILTGEIPYVN